MTNKAISLHLTIQTILFLKTIFQKNNSEKTKTQYLNTFISLKIQKNENFA